MLSLCFLNYWDFALASNDRQILIRGSHDEFFDVRAVNGEDFQRLRDLLQRFELEELQPEESGAKQIEDRLLALNTLRQATQTDPTDERARERFREALFEMIVDREQIEENTCLLELRSLAALYPADGAVRGYFARALGSALYYAEIVGDL